jgi:arabinan endo-1,5-alpha-L-arabinosidase
LDFDGSDDRVALSKSVSVLSFFSASFWIYPKGPLNAVLFGGDPAAYWPYIDSSSIYISVPPGDFVLVSSHTLTSTQWNSLILVAEGSSTACYINGKFVNRISTTRVPVLSSLGSYSNGNFPFNGQLDDIRIYSRALTPSEIRLLASRRGIGLQPRPKQFTYYQFPSGSKRRRILTGMT